MISHAGAGAVSAWATKEAIPTGVVTDRAVAWAGARIMINRAAAGAASVWATIEVIPAGAVTGRDRVTDRATWAGHPGMADQVTAILAPALPRGLLKSPQAGIPESTSPVVGCRVGECLDMAHRALALEHPAIADSEWGAE